MTGAARLSAAAVAAAVFLGSWLAIHEGFYARDRLDDTPVYERYGEAMRDGQVPYRDFAVEYPPAALPAFVLPTFVDDYEGAFEWLMAACGLLLVAALAWARASPPALAFAALWPLALGSVALARYDLWPVALTAGALAALLNGRNRLGAGVLGLAAAAKLFPAVLAPLAAVWIWRRAGPRAALVGGGVFVAVLAAAFMPFAVLGAGGLAESFGRQLSRPVQIESLWGAMLILRQDVEVVSSHGSQNVAGTLGDAVGIAATVVQLTALVAVWLSFARGPATRERFVRYAALALVTLVALGKVLSPQFLIWLIPVVALAGLGPMLVLGAALVLTQVWFPFRYWDYARTLDEAVTWLVLARDLVLVALSGLLLAAARRRSPARPRRTPPPRPRS